MDRINYVMNTQEKQIFQLSIQLEKTLTTKKFDLNHCKHNHRQN